MIKLGKGFVSEDCLEAIVPDDNGRGYAVVTTGHVIRVDATADEVAAALETAGLIALDPPDIVEAVSFSSGEVLQLRGLFANGYRFVAKDKDGKVFAYRARPDKGTISWRIYSNSPDDVKRLGGEFALLSFDDAAPLDLAKMFASG